MATAKKKYFVHPKYDQQEFLGVIIGHRRINLVGKDYTQVIPAGRKGPETKVVWKGATPADLEAYYNLGNQKIVIQDDDVPGTPNA